MSAQLTYYTMRSHVFHVMVMPGVPGIGYTPGTIRNRGIEATITGKVLTGPATGWDVTLSLWGNQNRLVKIDGRQSVLGSNARCWDIPSGDTGRPPYGASPM